MFSFADFDDQSGFDDRELQWSRPEARLEERK
jgi:hypothetical protein